MSSDPHPLKTQILGTVAGTLIVTAILWLFGYLPRLGHWLWSIAERMWWTLTSPVTLPLWLIIGLTVCLGIVGFRLVRRSGHPQLAVALQDRVQAEQPPPTPKLPPWYTKPQDRVGTIADVFMDALHKRDGGMIAPFSLQSQGGYTRLEIQEAIDRLLHYDMVEYFGDYAGGRPELALTPQGRRYLLTR
jgi:hypothetical protein